MHWYNIDLLFILQAFTLENNEKCLKLSNVDSFDIIDHARTRFALNLQEALHIKWDEPNLNKQVRHEMINIAV